MRRLNGSVTLFVLKDKLTTFLGIAAGKVQSVSESDGAIAQSLMTDVPGRWRTIVMRTNPFSEDRSRKFIHTIEFFCPQNQIDMDVTNGDQLAQLW